MAAADFAAYAYDVGLDDKRFDECFTSEATAARVKADQELAKRLGVGGTPTLFLGRMRIDGGIDLVERVNRCQILGGALQFVEGEGPLENPQCWHGALHDHVRCVKDEEVLVQHWCEHYMSWCQSCPEGAPQCNG